MFTKNVLLFFFGIVFSFSNILFSENNPDDVIGIWATEGGKSNVEILKKNGKYYGKVVSLKSEIETGVIKYDKNNPESKYNKRRIVGIEVLKSFSFNNEEKEWDEGTIYDPENGKTYSCIIMKEKRNELLIRGYIGISLFGRTTIWKKVKL